jgi:hypothetical protein
MSTILFECDVTEFDIIPKIENQENCFAINDKSMVINFMDKHGENILYQSEIERKDAIELAKLILLKP